MSNGAASALSPLERLRDATHRYWDEDESMFAPEPLAIRKVYVHKIQIVLMIHLCVWMVLSMVFFIIFIHGASDACTATVSCLTISEVPFVAWFFLYSGCLLGMHAMLQHTIFIRNADITSEVRRFKYAQEAAGGAVSGSSDKTPSAGEMFLAFGRIRRHRLGWLLVGTAFDLNVLLWGGWGLSSADNHGGIYPWPLWITILTFLGCIVYQLWESSILKQGREHPSEVGSAADARPDPGIELHVAD